MQKENTCLKLIVCSLLFGTLLPLTASGQDAAQADPNELLKVIPADAAGFLAARHLKQLDNEVVAVCQMLQLPVGPNNVFPGPVEFLQQEFGFGEGFRPEGALGVALLNCRNVQTSAEIADRLVLLIPISNAEQFANSVMAEKEDDLYKLHLVGETMIAGVKGGYMVAAQKAETVKAFIRSDDQGVISVMSRDRVQAFGRNDVFMWVNGDAFSQDLRQEVIMTMTGMMAMAGGGMPGGAANPNTEAFTLYLEGTKEFTFGIDVDARKGFLLSFYVRPKEDSQLARVLQYKPRPEGSLLMGLPAEPTVMAYAALGTKMTPFAENQIKSSMEMLFGLAMLGEVLPEEEQAAVVKLILDFARNVTALNVSLTSLPAANGDGLAGFASVMTVEDSAQCREQLQSIFDKVISTIISVAKKEEMPEEELKSLEKFVVLNRGAETLGGVKVDHFLVDLAQIPDAEDADIEQANAILGKEGVLIRMGAVDGKHVLITFGGGAERFEKIAGLINAKEAPLTKSAEIQKVADRLPTDNSLMEFYLNLDHLLTMVSTIANEAGSPLPFPFQMQNTAPLAFSGVPYEGNAMEMHMLVPMELAVSVKNVVTQFMMLMMGGPQEGGPPPPPPPGQPGGGGELN